MSCKLNNICVTVSLPCGRHWPPGALSCGHCLGPSTHTWGGQEPRPATSAAWPPGAGSVAGFSTTLWAASVLGPRTEGGPYSVLGTEGSGTSASSRFPGTTLAPKTEACPVPLALPLRRLLQGRSLVCPGVEGTHPVIPAGTGQGHPQDRSPGRLDTRTAAAPAWGPSSPSPPRWSSQP